MFTQSMNLCCYMCSSGIKRSYSQSQRKSAS